MEIAVVGQLEFTLGFQLAGVENLYNPSDDEELITEHGHPLLISSHFHGVDVSRAARGGVKAFHALQGSILPLVIFATTSNGKELALG